MYVSHRYHTNQIPVMKGWYESGVNVKFLSQYEGVGEVHEYVDYHKMKPSILFVIYSWLVGKIYSPIIAEKKRITGFVPDIFSLWKTIRDFDPDVVIYRDYNKCNAIITVICRMLGKKNIINYTQTPIYGYNTKKHLFSNIASFFYSTICFSPILYRGAIRDKRDMGTEWYSPKYYVPLICDEPQSIDKKYCIDGVVQLLDVGKYRDYKNHFFIIKALSEVDDIERFHLTVIGQLSQQKEYDYYNELNKYVEELGLQKNVTIKGNVPYKEMTEIYKNSDILILASKHEAASISVLEAMANGLCVMSTVNNGTACYLDENKVGFTFNTNNTNEIVNQLNQIANDMNIVKVEGRKGLEAVKNNYTFKQYKECLNVITTNNYGINV